MAAQSDLVELELLVKAAAAPEVVTAENVADARPRAEDVEECRRWLAARGLECHATGFGVLCRGAAEAVEAVFGDLEQPVAPQEIANLVEQVTRPKRPELF